MDIVEITPKRDVNQIKAITADSSDLIFAKDTAFSVRCKQVEPALGGPREGSALRNGIAKGKR